MLAGLILGLLSDLLVSPTRTLYYKLHTLDFIRDYRRDDDDFRQVNAQRCSLIASKTSLFLLQESTYEVIIASPRGFYPKNASEQPLSTNFALNSLTFLVQN
jgi:hypothetical protein